MQNLEVFKNKDFGSVRALLVNDKPWFVGKDVTDALGYSNPRDVMSRHVDNEDKIPDVVIYDGRNKNVATQRYIEQGLFELKENLTLNSYNAIHRTNFKVTDIRDIKAEYLEVKDTYKYCYIMTYSFPCTDLSVAGKMKGMKKRKWHTFWIALGS